MAAYSPLSDLEICLDDLAAWLNDKALPIWSTIGYDAVSGGFFERINQTGSPSAGDNRRARVQPRQVYCYTAAGCDGWEGDWQRVAAGGFAWFDKVYARPDGLYGALAGPGGMLIDDSFDLYNQAFALFAFAGIAQALPARLSEMEAKARALLDRLKARYAHPELGFEEDNPPKLPLCSNPHMHLLEAALSWRGLAADPAPWNKLADDIVDLAMTRFIDGESGGLREFFNADWRPFPGDKGRIMEPGHQFEWAWLLVRWGAPLNDTRALAKAKRMYDIGVSHGICKDRQVAIMGLYDDFSICDPMARLWPQTEWLKASGILARYSSGAERDGYLRDAFRAANALQKFFKTAVPGLWYDKIKPDGQFVDEPAPASSFYHIVCAIRETKTLLTALAEELVPAQ